MPAKKRSTARSGKTRKSAAKGKASAAETRESSKFKRPATKARVAARRAAVNFVPVGEDPTLENLKKVDHIVVLMLENRSFDHMLGYLKLVNERNDIDGLVLGMANKHNGKIYPAHHLTTTAVTDAQDPCHHGDCVAEQVSNDNGGFVSNFARTHTDPYLGVVMGYYNGVDLPVYDHLAREFCVCDRWFAPVPGATWPNRLYAVTGRADKKKDNKKVPLYDLPSFVRHLDDRKVSWRWYGYEGFLGIRLTTLKLIDGKYRFSGHHSKVENDFFEHAAQGRLPAVSWIDPNFVDFSGTSGANDDHPPADLLAGQDLVLKIYHSLLNSPSWSKTLLVVTYDEHGGFFDHVAPGPVADDNPKFRSLGVRVPAFLVSPWVKRGESSHTRFDHTSIIKTILLRFCRNKSGIPDMGARVTAANHLGGLLTETSPRDPAPLADYQQALDRIAEWHSAAFKQKMQTIASRAPAAPLNEFQQGLLAASKRLAAEGKK
jgi:phospholipase C